MNVLIAALPEFLGGLGTVSVMGAGRWARRRWYDRNRAQPSSPSRAASPDR